jgi:predicted secreted protein
MALSTTAEPAFGTLLKMCADANGTSPTTVAEVKDINFNLDAQIEDATTHSTAVPWRVKVATLLNMGSVEFMVNWVPTAATHDGITGVLYVFAQRAERTWQLVETDAGSTTYEYQAIVQGIKMGRPTAGLRSGNVTLAGTGQPDFDA